MTDLTKIEKPYAFCTKEQQEGLKGLLSTPDALQHLGVDGKWADALQHLGVDGEWDRLLCWDRSLMMHLTYRQNPAWNPPTLDVPDWFWENMDYNYVAVDKGGAVYAYQCKPKKTTITWDDIGTRILRLDKLFARHNFNPHNIPWDQSLTVRPGLEK